MTTFLQLNRQLPVRDNVDVLVAGGGPAGMAAAVTAARTGKSVLLVEYQNCLGGMGTAGLLPVFMPFADSVHFYAGGFGRELHDRMEASGGFWPDYLWGSPQIRAEKLKLLYDEMAAESGVKLRLMTQVIAVEANEGQLSHVICASKNGIFAIAAKMVIDCTGDGDLAAWAGAEFEKGDAQECLMPGTLCSLWAGVDWPAVRAAKQSPEKVVTRVIEDNPQFFTVPDAHLVGMLPVATEIGGGNIGHIFNLDGSNDDSITEALLQARRTLPEYEAFYRQYMTGCENVELIATAALLGVRETRRIIGDYILNYEDFLNQAIFNDEIGRYNYWIDRHPEKPEKQLLDDHNKRLHNSFKQGDSYGIPYRILTPRGLKNLLVAGRCVSTDRDVQASIRVMPGCYITGQAAGMAAAMAIENDTDTRGISITKLQQRLAAIGAFLPNAKEV